jgi:MFS family permease
VFAGDGQSLYAKIGLLASLTVGVSVVMSYIYGKVIDRRAGGTLLVASTIANALTHLVRPIVQNWGGVLANNVANEVATTGYSMAFTRGLFETADQSGYRIAYLFLIEIAVNIGGMLSTLLLGLCILIASGPNGFNAFFPIVAIFTLLIGFPRFMLYKK